MYRIRFSPYSKQNKATPNDDNLLCHRVYSIDDQMIYKFMLQHKFDMSAVTIETLPNDYDGDDLEYHTLQEYQMFSNTTKQIHHIVTTSEYVTAATETVVEGLSDYLIFGEMIFRRDIPFINIVNKLIDDIPMIFAFDYDILDGCPACDTSYFTVKKDLEQFEQEYENSDYDLSSLDDLYNRFMFKINPSRRLPITLEAYVRYFVKHVITFSDRRDSTWVKS